MLNKNLLFYIIYMDISGQGLKVYWTCLSLIYDSLKFYWYFIMNITTQTLTELVVSMFVVTSSCL
jgi:hypothetical protein